LVPLAASASITAAVLLVGQQLLGDGGMTVYLIGEQSLRQALLPETVIGRVTSFFVMLELGMLIAGSALGGWLGEAFGVRAAVVISFGVTAVALAVLWMSPAAKARIAMAQI
jgi:hypothetical protein